LRAWFRYASLLTVSRAVVAIASWRLRRRLRGTGRQRLAPAQLSHGLIAGRVVLRMTPAGSDGTIGDLYSALHPVDAERLSRELRHLAKKAGRDKQHVIGKAVAPQQ
jgi:hypothetical protein